MITKVEALHSLRPGSEWVLRGDDLEWLDTNQTQPTEAEITAEVARLTAPGSMFQETASLPWPRHSAEGRTLPNTRISWPGWTW